MENWIVKRSSCYLLTVKTTRLSIVVILMISSISCRTPSPPRNFCHTLPAPSGYSGTWRGWSQTGSFWFAQDYTNGIKNGICREWYSDGKLRSETPYRTGKIQGVARCWYPNGQKQYEMMYSEGKHHGTSKWWYENGQLSGVAYYKNDVSTGTHIDWETNGMLRSADYYEAGKRVKLEIWNEEGILIRTIPDTDQRKASETESTNGLGPQMTSPNEAPRSE
jgi:hypothetical protein